MIACTLLPLVDVLWFRLCVSLLFPAHLTLETSCHRTQYAHCAHTLAIIFSSSSSVVVCSSVSLCNPVLQRGWRDEDMCKLLLSCPFALDVLTIRIVQVARLRRWSGARSSGGQLPSVATMATKKKDASVKIMVKPKTARVCVGLFLFLFSVLWCFFSIEDQGQPGDKPWLAE